MKIRIKFRKWGVMRFVGHLDIMRFFQKAMRRAQIDIAYSAGFNPHQIMSFAAPLGVGLTSDGEYMDIEVHSTASSEAAIAALNAVMADGIAVTGYRLLPDDAKNAMSIVAAADYAITFSEEAFLESTPDFAMLTKRLMEKPEILVTKKTKKSERQIDLRPLIYVLWAENNLQGEAGDSPYIQMQIATGSAVNIKPAQVLSVLARTEQEACGTDRLAQVLSQRSYAIHTKRLEVYTNAGTEEEKHFVPLGELGESIG